MRTVLAVFTAALLVGADLAAADVVSDHPAAILIFPRVLSSVFTVEDVDLRLDQTTDTVIQLSNTSNEPALVHCFYVNATGRCSLSDNACVPDIGRSLDCPLPQDLCLPQWTETDFEVVLTPRQPLAWTASHGLLRADLPLSAPGFVGPRGESNSGTLVPPVRLRPAFRPPGGGELSVFSGELKCVVVDESHRATARNVIKGEASVVFVENFLLNGSEAQLVRSAKYNAIGVQAIEGDANGDDVLVLGGEANEYNGCPNVLVAQHFFDGATFPDDVGEPLRSELTLVPCTQNLRSQIPGSTTAQFLVFNEFEQRLSTSVRVDCLFRKLLSDIDTRQPERSIFFIGVQGTLSGQTRIRGVDAGLVGVLTELYGQSTGIEGELPSGASFNLGMQGDRERPDSITLPR